MTQLTNFVIEKLQKEIIEKNSPLKNKLFILISIPFITPVVVYILLVLGIMISVFALIVIPKIIIQNWLKKKENKNGDNESDGTEKSGST